MKRLLLCSFYFPPIGGAGTQRPTQFARRFETMGISCTVLTGTGVRRSRWTPEDRTFLDILPPTLDIVRARGPEPPPPSQGRKRLERRLLLEPRWSRWWTDAAEAAVAAVQDTLRVDAIYTIMSPFESARLSFALSRRLKVPWIADLGDPWALDEMAVYPTGIHRALAVRQMRRYLGTAAGIVMSTPEAAAELVREFPEMRDKPIMAIPNGYDANDFAGPRPPRNDDHFRIVHTGYLHTELGLRQRRRRAARRILGGQVSGVEILTRSHVYLLKALEELARVEPEMAEGVDLVLAGLLSDDDRAVSAGSRFVQLPGYLSHGESVALLRTADLLFLPMQKLAPGRRSTTVPGKTYEYVASGTPILAAVPEGDARDILVSAGTAAVCEPDDVDAMVNVLRSWIGHPPRLELNRDAIECFEYGRLATQAAEFAKDVVERSRVHSGATRRLRAPIRVLIISYHFPPIGGAGTQRTLKLVRYLDRSRFEPIVVTGCGATEGRWTPTDETLRSEIPADIRVLRVPGPEPRTTRGWERAHRWLGVATPWSRWWRNGVMQATENVDYDIILASSSPYETAGLAAALSDRAGVPWIAALRDPWALDEMAIYPTGLHRRIEIARMRRQLRTASSVVLTTDEAAKRFCEFLSAAGRAQLVVAVPNGYDAADLPAESPASPDGKLRIVHTGYFHTKLGLRQRRRRLSKLLGGQTSGVDLLTRSHVYLYEAIERLLEQDPSLGNRLEVHLAGVLDETDVGVTQRTGLTTFHGYLPHSESIRLMRSADLLFLPMQNLPQGTRSTTIPGKTFEYLAVGRPILAAVPEGDARDILIRTGHTVCDPDDVDGLVAAIRAALRRHEEGHDCFEPRWDLVREFERREIARRFGEVIQAVSSGSAPRIDVGSRP